MSESIKAVDSVLGDNQDMIVVFNQQFEKVKTVFEECNTSTEIVPIRKAHRANFLRDDYSGNIQNLVDREFFRIEKDKVDALAIIAKFSNLKLDMSKVEVVKRKKKVVEGEEASENGERSTDSE